MKKTIFPTPSHRPAPSTTCPRCTTPTTCTLPPAPGSWPSPTSTRQARHPCTAAPVQAWVHYPARPAGRAWRVPRSTGTPPCAALGFGPGHGNWPCQRPQPPTPILSTPRQPPYPPPPTPTPPQHHHHHPRRAWCTACAPRRPWRTRRSSTATTMMPSSARVRCARPAPRPAHPGAGCGKAAKHRSCAGGLPRLHVQRMAPLLALRRSVWEGPSNPDHNPPPAPRPPPPTPRVLQP